ncbi:MAG TPA: hypothetical protein VJ809_12075, partial [Pirellulales bacterium]|nr:hypothetical protein [Pirellulales bacterium]
MSSASGIVYDVHVSTGGSQDPRRDPESPAHPDLPAALAAIRQRYLGGNGGDPPLRGRDTIDIVVGSAGASNLIVTRNPRYEFFIDPLATDETTSNGSGSAPWPSLAVALVGLEQLHAAGELDPAPGERIRLTVREPFSTSPVDTRKRRTEQLARAVLLCMTMLLVVPLVAILGYLFYKAWP